MTERFMVIMMIEMTGYIYDENDDMAPVMDAILQRIGMGVSYGKDDDNEWITKVHHRDMEDALEAMLPKEREIVKKFFYEDKRMLDISKEMNMDMDLVGGYIKSARDQIAIWM